MASVKQEHDTELQMMRAHFEDYGESLYVRLSNEVSDRISSEVRRFEAELSSQIRRDTLSMLMENLRHQEKQVMILES